MHVYGTVSVPTVDVVSPNPGAVGAPTPQWIVEVYVPMKAILYSPAADGVNVNSTIAVGDALGTKSECANHVV